jgi:osmotically-inducible protein OsmY
MIKEQYIMLTIKAKIRASYAQDPLLSPYNIDVDTHRGVVKLSGKVPNKDVKKYAIKVARYTKGVLAVEPKKLVIGR